MQTRKMSLLEVCLSTAIGFLIAYLSQIFIFPLYGIEINHFAHLQITGIFTVISIARSYVLRRYFNGRLGATGQTQCSLCGSGGHTAALCPWAVLCSVAVGIGIAALVFLIALAAGRVFEIDGNNGMIFVWTCFFSLMAVYLIFQLVGRKF